MIERGQVCMLPSRARLTAAEFEALPLATSKPEAASQIFGPIFAAEPNDRFRGIVNGKWCLLTVQFHFGCRQVYAERITIVAKEQAA